MSRFHYEDEHMFDRFQEEMDYEFNARYDYITEAYAGMQEDPAVLASEAEADYLDWEAEQAELTAAFGPIVLPRVWAGEDLPF
jgi:hypothetical protein